MRRFDGTHPHIGLQGSQAQGVAEVSVTGSGEWFPDWIELRHLGTDENWAYPIGRMLRSSDGPLRFAAAPLYEYSISVKTGDAENSGTDSAISMTFVASNGTTDRFQLDKPSRDDFERGNTDTFTRRSVTAPSLLTQMRLENRGDDLWRCDWVEVREKNPAIAALVLLRVQRAGRRRGEVHGGWGDGER